LSLKLLKHRARIFVALMIIMQILLMPIAVIAAESIEHVDSARAEVSASAPDSTPAPATAPNPEPATAAIDPVTVQDQDPAANPDPAPVAVPDPAADIGSADSTGEATGDEADSGFIESSSYDDDRLYIRNRYQ